MLACTSIKGTDKQNCIMMLVSMLFAAPQYTQTKCQQSRPSEVSESLPSGAGSELSPSEVLEPIPNETYTANYMAASSTATEDYLLPTETESSNNSTSGGRMFMPYLDVSSNPDLLDISTKSGSKFFTLAFITAANDAITFDGNPLSEYSPFYLDKIQALRAAGGDVGISIGGLAGQELATAITDLAKLIAAYQSVIDIYSLKYIDIDVEGAANLGKDVVDRRSKALVAIQTKNPALKITFTLPVLPSGLVDTGMYLLKSASAAGLIPFEIRVMSMDFGPPATNGEMGKLVIQSAEAVHKQIDSTFTGKKPSVGIIPMIGVNDVVTEIFGLDDARAVLAFAQKSSWVSCLSFWSLNRDRASTYSSSTASSTSSSIKQDDYAFAKIFSEFK